MQFKRSQQSEIDDNSRQISNSICSNAIPPFSNKKSKIYYRNKEKALKKLKNINLILENIFELTKK